ncbi:3-deoxy-manno-octulosonate-8-phosphatase KdsC [Paraglaciecola polaris]|uniref:3-deoxy-D-manno-octulosonate 8-phosphate phosphatase KdsC n=1 Tax=Paraglaciecola polaris LMG 21857 TaxID=1129793 RepID=K6ZZI7_9ALTE|nr:3-deoxy-manno-octulosonate-8-phosphatase KdsC [Paraglaciecola polaris]GAC35627.1 3-deoxy-D-manno-octulosonate 8-phosphate phosphatase [Paraglaciecola polaris LMG 21857]|tara:strand:- start:10037 stop:10591 length:555 start_codon:yes stop_codon:yes gene_type:complete
MSDINTLYGCKSSSLMDKFSRIRLLACDVDGVFSDGRIYMGNAGEELKAFHTRDGFGVKALMNIGVHVAVITGRESKIVQQRMSALGVKHIIQGCEAKDTALAALQRELKIGKEATASMGDDMPDIGMFDLSHIAIATSDAHPFVKKQALYITQINGGFGAVREVCDLILHAKGKLNKVTGTSI